MPKFWTKAAKFRKILKLSKKHHIVILEDMILQKLARFQLSRSFVQELFHSCKLLENYNFVIFAIFCS